MSRFSTGHPQLDNRIGGIQPGDVILFVLTKSVSAENIIRTAIDHSARQRIPLQYLSINDSLSGLLNSHPKPRIQNILEPGEKPEFMLRNLKRFSRSRTRKGYLLVDDFAVWKQRLKKDSIILDSFSILRDFARKNKCVLISTVIRSEIPIPALIRLKDIADVSLEVIEHRGTLWGFPLHAKGRYVSGSLLPVRLLTRVKTGRNADKPEGEEESGHTAKMLAAIDTYEGQHNQLFDVLREPLILFDLDGGRRECNDACSRLLGYDSTELSVISIWSIVAPESKKDALKFIARLSQKKFGTAALEIFTKKKRGLTIQVRASHISAGLYFGILTDVTEQKKLENKYLKIGTDYNRIFKTIPSPVIVVHNGKILQANEAFRMDLGYDAASEVEKVVLRKFLSPESYRRLQKHLEEVDAISSPVSATIEFIHKNGSKFSYNCSLAPLLFDGNECILITAFNITEYKNIVDKLTASEQKYLALVESSYNPACVIRKNTFVFLNKTFRSIFSIEQDQPILLEDFAGLFDTADREKVLHFLKKGIAKSVKSSTHTCRFQDRDGKMTAFHINLVPVENAVVGDAIVFLSDRSEYEELKDEADRRSEEISLLKTLIPLLETSKDAGKLVHNALSRVMDTLEWEMGAVHIAEVASRTLTMKSHRGMPEILVRKLSSLDQSEGIGGLLSKTLEPHIFTVDRYPSYLPLRSAFKEAGVRTLAFVPLISAEKLIGVISLYTAKEKGGVRYTADLLAAVGHNIGNSLVAASAYQKLEEAEEHKSQLLDLGTDVPYSITPAGGFIFLGPHIEKISGYQVREFLRNTSLWLGLVHPDDKQLLLNRIVRLHEIQERYTIEYRLLPRGKAEYRWLRDTIVVRKNDAGVIQRVDGTVSDITDQKLLIDRLSHDSSIRKNALDGLCEGVLAFDRQEKCFLTNTCIETITEKSAHEFVGATASGLEQSLNIPGLQNYVRRALGGEFVSSEDIPFHTGAGKSGRYLQAMISPMGGKNEILGAVALFIDVTRRRTVENEVRDSEHLLKNVIDAMGDMLIITDLRGRVVDVNRAFVNTLGYNRTEAVGCEFPYPWLLEDQMGKFVLWIANLRERNWLHDFDMTLRKNDGKLVPISLNTTLLRNKLGEPIAMVNVARDITDRMRLINELENKNKQIELINRIITAANQTQDFQEIFRTIANEVSTVVICNGISIAIVPPGGQSLRVYAAQGTTGYRVSDLIEPKESPPYRALRSRQAVIVYDMHKDEPSRAVGLTDGSIRSYMSLPIILRGKNFGTLNLESKEPHAFSDDHINLLQPIAQQIGAIIDRVELFEQVANDAVYIHNLLDSIDSVVFTIDRDLRVSEINHAFRLYMRDYEPDENVQFVGKYLYDIIRENSLKIVLQNIVPSLLNGNIRIFSQEYEHTTSSGLRTYQLIINPMIINRVVTGLVFMHTDITNIKKTEAELKKSNRQLLALNQISTLISASLKIGELMNAALPLLKNTLDAGAVIVYEHNIEHDEITIVSQIGFDTVEFSSVNRLQLSGSATGDVIISQQPMYIEREPYNDERIVQRNRGVLRSLQIEAMAIIPLISKGKVFGALDIFYTTPHDFSPHDRQILSLLGNQLGAALHNLHLYSELRSQVERLTVLYELSQSLTSTLDIDEIFSQVFTHIRKIISCEDIRIDLYSPGASQLTRIFEALSNAEGVYSISKGAESSGLVPGSPEAVVVSSKSSYLSAEKNNLVIPMSSKETIIGIMALRSADPLSFTSQELTILESIANLVAIAFEKAQLHHETVQKSIEIERHNKELDDFTYVVSHDLKEPLISVEGFSRILQTDYEGVIQPEGKEYLDSIVGATTRMKGLIDDLLLLSRVSRPMESYTEVNLDKIVGEIRTDMEFTILQRNVTFSVPEALPGIYCNGPQIKIVFRNLIANAIKFNDKPNPSVKIGFRNAENNCYLFYVRDNGIGIEKEFYDKIFVIFQRLHRREEYEGSGAGLAIVKKIIEFHKGKIWVDSEIGIGTTFYFTIPKTRPQES